MMQIVKQFFKPSWKKIILFLVMFLVMFFEMPFVKSSSSFGVKNLLWLIKNYSGQKEILSIIISGLIIYFIVAYFIACLIISLWKIKKEKFNDGDSILK